MTNSGFINDGNFTGATVTNNDTIKGGTFTDVKVTNNHEINDGTFTGTVTNSGTITGGDFKGATVTNEEDGAVSGGVFKNFSLKDGTLTITGTVDLDAEDALAPLTIALGGESIKSVTIAAGGSFDAGSTTVPVPVTNNGGGEITGGTFSSRVENSGTITNGTFSDHVENTGKITNGAFSGVVENSGTISGEITIAKGGSLNNHADGTISGDITIAEYGSLNNNAGGTISSGTFTVHGGMNNQGTITGSATFEILGVAALTNDGTISGGSFTGRVTNDGEITGGTFSGAEVYNKTSGKITGGTFGNGMVVNNRGSIADGDFRGATVTNYDDGTVTGGTFDKFTVATDEDGERTITITGAIDMDSANALHPLTIGLDAVKSVTIAAGGSFDAGSTTVSAHVFNYGGIGGGTFREGTVYNRNGGVISAGTFDTTVYNQGSKIAGGTFNATVNNADGGEISGGTFGSGVYNKSSITGAITLTSEQSLINDGGDISGNITFTKEATLINDGGDISGNITFTEGEYLANSGKITGGAISGATVANRSGGIIFDGTFTDATVTNDGIIAYGDFRAAEVTNRDGSITGGIFKNCTLKDGELTITQNVDLREDADALAPLSLAEDPFAKLEIASGCAFNAGNNTVSVYVINNGTITGGTFENSLLDNSGTISGGTFNNGDVLNNPGGTISGGAFSGCTYNFGAITGGTFAEIVLTGASARVQGVDGSVPTLNGPIENGMGGSILQPCNFGANASVVENRGVIEVPATVNNIPQSLRYGEKTLEQLKKINPNDVWFEQAADGTLKRVAESATVDLVSRTYVSRNLPAVEAPQAEIDFDGETLTVSLDTSSALPEGLQMGELDVLFTCGGKSGIVRDAFANGNSCTVTLSALGNALGLTLPADNGSGDASLRVSLSAEGKEDGYNWGVAELTVPERPAATDPGAEKRAHETTDRSIQMLDAGMLAEYDFGVAVQADALPAEPALVDTDGDGLITGLAGDTEYCLYFRKKATDGAFRSAWFSSADVSARTNRSIPLAAGVETAEYAWMPDFTLQPSDIAEETVFARVEGGGDQAIPENAFALTITGENGAAVEGSITNAGTYTVNVALDCDNYVLAAGGDSFKITVRPLDLSGEDVVLRVEGPLTVGYTGASVYPQIGGNVLEVKVGGVDRGALPADCFTIGAVEGRNNVNAGEAYLTIVGQGNATGKTELAYTITARNIAGAGIAVEPIPGQTYTGSAIEPKVTVKDGGRALAEGTDYTVAYANNTAVGTATVTITGMDNYTGTRTVTFAIRAVEKDNEDEASEQDKQNKQEETAAEALTPAQQAEQLIGGRAVDGTVTDRHGEAMPYVPSTEEVTDEETREVLQRTLVITADPVRDENGEIVLRGGVPVYEQRNLHLSRGLLDALAELGYTHIRFVLGDAALEWPLASMTGDGYTVRLAPMEADELSQAEKDATGAVETLTGSYRARVTAMIEGEEVDVTNAIPSLTAIFDAASVRELAGDEMAQLLLVPNDGEPETQVSTVQHIEETDTENARYEAPLMESGLFVMTLQ